MKRIVVALTLFTLIGSSVFAGERTRMRPKDRLIIGIFSDVWSDLPKEMETQTINRGISIDYIQEFPLGTSNFSIASGLGFSSHNMYIKEDFMFAWDAENHNHDFLPITTDFSNHKLSLNYLNIPVEFRYRTRTLPKTFRVHAGIKGGVLVNAHTKYVGDDPGGLDREVKFKEARLENIETFMMGFYGRIGYGRVNLNAFIPLVDVFDGNSAQDASFISLGLTFIVF